MITDAQKAHLLREFVPAEKVDRDAMTHAWSLPKGTYVFPEGRCPFCKQPIMSKEIWVAEKRMVLGQYYFRGKKIHKRIHIEHPHAHASGGICMGNQRAGSEGAALFLGLTYGDSYWDREKWVKWLEDKFDHDCPSAWDD